MMVEPLDSDPPLDSILSDSDIQQSATGLLVIIVIHVTTTFHSVSIFKPHLDASLSVTSGNLSVQDELFQDQSPVWSGLDCGVTAVLAM